MSVVDKICHYQRNLEKCGDNEDRVRMWYRIAILKHSLCPIILM